MPSHTHLLHHTTPCLTPPHTKQTGGPGVPNDRTSYAMTALKSSRYFAKRNGRDHGNATPATPTPTPSATAAATDTATVTEYPPLSLFPVLSVYCIFSYVPNTSFPPSPVVLFEDDSPYFQWKHDVQSWRMLHDLCSECITVTPDRYGYIVCRVKCMCVMTSVSQCCVLYR